MKTKNNNLKLRRGRIKMSKEILMESSLDVLREVFSNFFPISMELVPDRTNWYTVQYYGLSPYFNELQEGDEIPLYDMILKKNKNGKYKFDKIVKI